MAPVGGGGVLLQRVDTEQDGYLVYLSTRDTQPSAGLCCEGGDMIRRGVFATI